MPNRFSHCYHLDESTFTFSGLGSNFSVLLRFSVKIMSANRISPDGMPRLAVSHPGLFCLCPIKRMTGLYGLGRFFFISWFTDPPIQIFAF